MRDDVSSISDNDSPLTAAAFAALPDIPFLLREKAIAVAVSGGPDSMALCWLLSQAAQTLKTAERPMLHTITVDHGLRAEAAAEAKQAGRWLKGWPNVRHKILTLKKRRGADSRLMESARRGRYDALAAYCREHDIGALLTAHHRDDQAETFLFRLAKGSGTDGLGGMRVQQAYNEKLTIFRPLLDIPKARLVTTCRAQAIPFVEDPTNANPDFVRSRLRQSWPVLAREGLTAKRLGVTAARLRRAADALDHYAGLAFDAALVEKTKDSVALAFDPLAATPAEVRFRVLLRVMTMLRRTDDAAGYGPRRERLEALAADLFAPAVFRKRTLGGCIFSYDRKNGHILIRREAGP